MKKFLRKKSVIRSQEERPDVQRTTDESYPTPRATPRAGNMTHREGGKDTSAQTTIMYATKTGYLTKRGGQIKTWKRRFFVLVNNELLYYRDEYSSEPLGSIIIEGPSSVERADKELGKENSFKIVSTQRQRTLYCSAESEYVAENWMHALKTCAKQKISVFIFDAVITGTLKKYNPMDKNWKDVFCSVHAKNLYTFKDEQVADLLQEYPLLGASIKRVDELYGVESIQVDVPEQQTSIILSSDYDDIEIWEHVIKERTKASYENTGKTTRAKGWLHMDVDGRRKNWRPYYFVLQGTSLFYFTSDKAREPEGVIECVARIITRTDKEIDYAFSFKIESASEVVYLRAESEKDAEGWVAILKSVTRTQVQEGIQKTGWISKQGGSIKTWKRRWAVLKGNELFYYKEKTDTEPKGSILLPGQMVRCLTTKEARDEVDRKHVRIPNLVLKIYQEHRIWYIETDTEQDLIEWGIVLRKAALKFPGRTLVVSVFATKHSGSYPTISEAVREANPLDVIQIQSGEYEEEILVNKPLKFEAVGDVKIISKNLPCMTINTTGACLVIGCKFKSTGTTDVDCIHIKQGNIMMQDCEMASRSANGVSCANISQVTLSNCRIHGCGQYGVYTHGKASCLLENITITECGWDGVILMGEADGIIRNCNISKNNYNGIAISSDGRCNVEHCDISYNAWDGISLKERKATCVFYNNKIHNNGGFGIYFKVYAKSNKKEVSFNVQETDNQFYENKKGDMNPQ